MQQNVQQTRTLQQHGSRFAFRPFSLRSLQLVTVAAQPAAHFNLYTFRNANIQGSSSPLAGVMALWGRTSCPGAPTSHVCGVSCGGVCAQQRRGV